jgi:predicted GNAT family N-acyltransferase
LAIPNFFLEPANYAADYDDLHFVRTTVFVIEQQIPAEMEFDQLDPHCHHFIARDLHARPIGCGRLSADGKIGRMAVLREWRQQGVGASLLRDLLEKAQKLGLTQVTANAQLSALGFYQRFGFSTQGEMFNEAGIAHQIVCLPLAALEQPQPRPSPKPRAASVEAMRLDSIESAMAATLDLIAQSKRQLCIYSQDLEYGLYGDSGVVEAIKQFVLGDRNSSVQIIIQEPANLRNQYHPLIELTQKLPSYFLLRAPLEAEDLQNQSAFVVNDAGGYLFRLLGNRYEGHWSPNLPARNRPLREDFERVWQRSRPCTEFRALGL